MPDPAPNFLGRSVAYRGTDSGIIATLHVPSGYQPPDRVKLYLDTRLGSGYENFALMRDVPSISDWAISRTAEQANERIAEKTRDDPAVAPPLPEDPLMGEDPADPSETGEDTGWGSSLDKVQIIPEEGIRVPMREAMEELKDMMGKSYPGDTRLRAAQMVLGVEEGHQQRVHHHDMVLLERAIPTLNKELSSE